MSGELTTIARFHAREDSAEAMAELLRAQPPLVRAEPGCLGIDMYRATRDARLFFIHSRWADAAAFEVHADLAHTSEFLEQMEALSDQPREVTRLQPL